MELLEYKSDESELSMLASSHAPLDNLMRKCHIEWKQFFSVRNKPKTNFFVCCYSQPIASMSESETEKTGDESETAENVEDMVTTTRSGRVITYKLESFEL